MNDDNATNEPLSIADWQRRLVSLDPGSAMVTQTMNGMVIQFAFRCNKCKGIEYVSCKKVGIGETVFSYKQRCESCKRILKRMRAERQSIR